MHTFHFITHTRRLAKFGSTQQPAAQGHYMNTNLKLFLDQVSTHWTRRKQLSKVARDLHHTTPRIRAGEMVTVTNTEEKSESRVRNCDKCWTV